MMSIALCSLRHGPRRGSPGKPVKLTSLASFSEGSALWQFKFGLGHVLKRMLQVALMPRQDQLEEAEYFVIMVTTKVSAGMASRRSSTTTGSKYYTFGEVQ